MKIFNYFILLFIISVNFIKAQTNETDSINNCVFNADFIGGIGNSGELFVIDFELFSSKNVTHEWYVLQRDDINTTNYTPIYSGVSTTDDSIVFMNDAQSGVHYTIVHKVYNDECEVCVTKGYSWSNSSPLNKSNLDNNDDTCSLVEQYWPNGILTTTESTIIDFIIYPNPTKNSVLINSKTKIKNIYVYNIFGKLVIKNSNLNKIDISNLREDVYIVKVEDINGNIEIKKIVKK